MVELNSTTITGLIALLLSGLWMTGPWLIRCITTIAVYILSIVRKFKASRISLAAMIGGGGLVVAGNMSSWLPDPPPPPPAEDVFTEFASAYRQLLADGWDEFADQEYDTEAAALDWINERNRAAFTAAFAPIHDLAATAAENGADARQQFAEDLRGRQLNGD